MALNPNVIKNYIFVDTETAGLEPDKHAIVSIAIIDKDGALHFTKVKPWSVITPKAAKTNGYTKAAWENAPRFRQIMKSLLEYLHYEDDTFIIGYNINFDLSFINAELKRNKNNTHIGYYTIDVMSLARTAFPYLKDHTLTTVCEHLHIPLEAHNPTSDVAATKAIFEILSKKLIDHDDAIFVK